MINSLKVFMIIGILSLNFLTEAAAQKSSITQTRRGLATVIFSGLGGAVLGLSTLSFYGNPQEHLGNISTGFALGLIGGSIYVANQSLRSPAEQLAKVDLNHWKPSAPKQPIYLSLNFEF